MGTKNKLWRKINLCNFPPRDISRGIKTTSLLLDRSITKISKFLPSFSRILPVKLFPHSSKHYGLGRSSMKEGILPWRLFLKRFGRVISFSWENSSRISLTSWLFERSIDFKILRLPMSGGIGSKRIFTCRNIISRFTGLLSLGGRGPRKLQANISKWTRFVNFPISSGIPPSYELRFLSSPRIFPLGSFPETTRYSSLLHPPYAAGMTSKN